MSIKNINKFTSLLVTRVAATLDNKAPMLNTDQCLEIKCFLTMDMFGTKQSVNTHTQLTAANANSATRCLGVQYLMHRDINCTQYTCKANCEIKHLVHVVQLSTYHATQTKYCSHMLNNAISRHNVPKQIIIVLLYCTVCSTILITNS